MAFTLTFADRNQETSGWTCFWSYYPEQMMSLGNRFYTVKNGQLFEHNDNDNPIMRTIYGQPMIAKIVSVFNDANAEDKIFKNLILEGNKAWDVEIKTNFTESTIKKEEFNRRESKWFAHTRKNEISDDLTDRTQGIGVVQSISSNQITFSQIPTMVSTGEILYQLNGNSSEEIGEITDIQGNVITLSNIVITPVQGYFAYSLKNARVQGSEIRGYYAEVTLTNNDSDKVELFAIDSNIVRSFVPTEY